MRQPVWLSYDIAPCFGLELPLNEILFSTEFWHEILVSGRCRFFPFKQLQAHVGCAEVTAYANQVSVFGSGAFHGFIRLHIAYTGDAYHEART